MHACTLEMEGQRRSQQGHPYPFLFLLQKSTVGVITVGVTAVGVITVGVITVGSSPALPPLLHAKMMKNHYIEFWG